jgi:hypothetical protein
MPYALSGNVEIGIWAKKSGTWQLVTTYPGWVYDGNIGSVGPHTVAGSVTGAFDLGPGVEAFGITMEGHDGTAASVTDLGSVSWTATAASGERSATPSGQSSTAVVTPN